MCDYWWNNIPFVSTTCVCWVVTLIIFSWPIPSLFEHLTNKGQYQLSPGVQSQYCRWRRIRGPYRRKQIFDPVTLLLVQSNNTTQHFFWYIHISFIKSNIIYCKTWHNINVMLKSVLRRIKNRHTRARDILYLPVIRTGF